MTADVLPFARVCGRCRHFRPSTAKDDPPDGGYCRGAPPSSNYVPMTDSTGVHARWVSAWPFVHKAEMACGLWKNRRRWWLLWLA